MDCNCCVNSSLKREFECGEVIIRFILNLTCIHCDFLADSIPSTSWFLSIHHVSCKFSSHACLLFFTPLYFFLNFLESIIARRDHPKMRWIKNYMRSKFWKALHQRTIRSNRKCVYINSNFLLIRSYDHKHSADIIYEITAVQMLNMKFFVQMNLILPPSRCSLIVKA